MVASQVMARAMSIADLQNSLIITYQDQQNSLFEAYKDLYSQITDNDDDYFINTIYLLTSQATSPSPGEYLFPLPNDFYKIRTIEFQQGPYWQVMERFSLGARGNPSSVPRYRFQGNNLWIVGWTYPGFTSSYQLRVHYYPIPVQPTFPDLPINYGRSITAGQLATITSPAYANILTFNGNAMIPDRNYFYVQGGLNLWNESIDSQFSSNIYTGSIGISEVQYYKGSLYFLDGTNIWSGAFSPATTPIVPAMVTITGAPVVVNFNVFQNTIFYSTSSQTYFTGLSGGTATSLGIGATLSYFPILTNSYYGYINSSGNLVVNGVNLGGSYSNAFCDNNLTVWALGTNGVLYAILLSMATPAAPTIVTTTTIQSDISQIGPYYVASNFTTGGIISPYSPMIPITGNESPRFQAISAVVDTDFSYPLNSNEVGELMAVQCAIDFKNKQDQDDTQLQKRKAELAGRMEENMRRDDYKMERVTNAYGSRGGPFGQGGF